jgi:hypothetical protein
MIRAASLHRSPESTKEDQRLRLLAGLTHVVHVQKADVERAAGLQEANWREFVGGQRAAGLKVSQAHRLTASLMRNYSVTQCIGPTSLGRWNREEITPTNVEEDFLLAGQESDFGGHRVPVRDEQTHPHRPRLVVSHSTCPPLSSSPHAHSFVIGPAVIKHAPPTCMPY